MSTCQHCSKVFADKYKLKRHIDTNQKCLPQYWKNEIDLVYSHECPDSRGMITAELLIVDKLKEYNSGPGVFTLPKEKDISMFIEAVNECISIVEKGDEYKDIEFIHI